MYFYHSRDYVTFIIEKVYSTLLGVVSRFGQVDAKLHTMGLAKRLLTSTKTLYGFGIPRLHSAIVFEKSLGMLEFESGTFVLLLSIIPVHNAELLRKTMHLRCINVNVSPTWILLRVF